MKQNILLVIFISVMFLVGCKKDAVKMEIANICAADNEKKYVSTSGILDDRGSIFCSNIGGGRMDCGVDVIAEAGGKRIFGADIEQGSSSDQIEKLASGYKKDDIKIRDDNGALVKVGDKVTLTGTMSIVPDGSVCFMTVDKIGK